MELFFFLIKVTKIISSLKSDFLHNLGIWSFINDYYELISYERGVAQLGSAGALGALGRRFESCRPDSLKPIHTSELPTLAFLLLLIVGS